jgi:hypothetical protein
MIDPEAAPSVQKTVACLEKFKVQSSRFKVGGMPIMNFP